jgi:Flp pilus assembly protein protease CpaA
VDIILDTWSVATKGEASLYIGLAFVWSILLGWSTYTDIFQNKTIPNTASMGMLFTAIAVAPFLYDNIEKHILWSVGLGLFFFLAFLLGAFADGDLKIYLAFAFLLGPAALIAALLSWVVIIIYSLPAIYQSLHKRKEKNRGERLGIAPAAPGIALSLPLTLMLLGVEGKYIVFFSLAIIFSFLLSLLLYHFDAKAKEIEKGTREDVDKESSLQE